LKILSSNLENLVRIGVVDVEKSSDLKARFSIQSTPTFIVFAGNQQYSYDDELKAKSIEKFAISKIPSYIAGEN
jgi:thioredoxin-related protein